MPLPSEGEARSWRFWQNSNIDFSAKQDSSCYIRNIIAVTTVTIATILLFTIIIYTTVTYKKSKCSFCYQGTTYMGHLVAYAHGYESNILDTFLWQVKLIFRVSYNPCLIRCKFNESIGHGIRNITTCRFEPGLVLVFVW